MKGLWQLLKHGKGVLLHEDFLKMLLMYPVQIDFSAGPCVDKDLQMIAVHEPYDIET